MTEAEWLALAKRCEEAEKESREIDGEIMFTAFAKPAGNTGYLWPEDNPSWVFAIRFPGKDAEWLKGCRSKEKETILVWRNGDPILMNDLRVPRLTASLDAIAALIDKALPNEISFQSDWRKGRVFMVWGDGTCTTVNAATPALALCAAFCKAMSARATGGPQVEANRKRNHPVERG